MPDIGTESERRALVTGGAGFIGSHLCERLVADGWHVTALDDLSAGRRENLEHVMGPRMHLEVADVRDRTRTAEWVRRSDVVFHLAAMVGVRRAVTEPRAVIENNLHATESVLAACRQYATRLVIASSSEVYGCNDAVPLDEDAARVLGPPQQQRWSYSAAKAIDEMLAYAHYVEGGLPVTVVRFFNTTGPRQSGDYGMVVPRFVAQALAGETLTVYGDGSQTRCFCHVRDTVDALVRIAGCDRTIGGVFNIGAAREISVAELADLVLSVVRRTCPEVPAAKPATRRIPHEEAYGRSFQDTPRRVPAIDRIRGAVGWDPSVTLEEIIEELCLMAVPA